MSGVSKHTVIVLSGCSRSGKSRLANELRSRLGGIVVGQDWFLNPLNGDTDEDPRCTDWSRFYGYVEEAIKKSGLVIVEGFQVLHDARIARLATFTYHLDLSKEEAFRRRSAKNSKERPNPRPKSLKYCEEILWPTHEKYVAESVDGSGAVRIDVDKHSFDEIVHRIIKDVKDESDEFIETYDKLKRNLGKAKSEGRTSFAVLVCTGSYCPVHLQHVKILEIAKDFLELEQPETSVIAGFMSPSHDFYVGHKLGEGTIPSTERIAMVQEATRDHPFVSAHPWEARQNRFRNFSEVSQVIRRDVREQFGRDIRVYYVCGTDHMRRCGLQNGMRGGVGVIGVQRLGEPSPILPENAEKLGVYLTRYDSEKSDASSTEVRERLKRFGNRAELGDLLHPEVEIRLKEWAKRKL